MQNRETLRGFFITNRIPTQDNFKDLIDSGLNQVDDGIKKTDPGPIGIRSPAGNDDLLYFYKDFDQPPVWKISAPGTGFNLSNTAAGDSRFYISAAGNIGIGTTTPAGKLSIKGSQGDIHIGGGLAGGDYNGIYLNGSAVASEYNFRSKQNDKHLYINRPSGQAIYFRQNDADQAIIASNGNVGIGTTTPVTKLQIGPKVIDDNNYVYDTNATYIIHPTPTSDTVLNDPKSVLILGRQGTGTKTYGAGAAFNLSRWKLDAGGVASQTRLDISLAHANFFSNPGGNSEMGATVMTLLSNGNVGIGTTKPLEKLSIKGNAGDIHIGGGLAGNDYNGIFLNGSNGAAEYNFRSKSGDKSLYINRPTDQAIYFRQNDVDQVIIASNGRVGIGTTSPRGTLDVAKDEDVYLCNTVNGGSGASLYLPGHIYMSPLGGDNICYLQARRQNNLGNTHLRLRTFNNGQLVEAMHISNTGYVGIGTNDPKVPLHVHTSANQAAGIRNAYYALSLTGNSTTNWIANAGVTATSSGNELISIKADQRIVADEFNAVSDQRIKKDIVRSIPANDLELLNRLQVVNYRYKDPIAMGDKLQKGILAQEVEQIFPEAVLTHTDFIPDVFSLPEHAVVEDGALLVTMKAAHGLSSGDVVRLVTPASTLELAVTVIDDISFRVADWKESSGEVFVYGKKVPDYRSVNYNSLFTLGISAIQEIYRQLQSLKAELFGLKESLPLMAPAIG